MSNVYFQITQENAELFSKVRDDVYKPHKVSTGGMTSIRTDNSSTGAPSGYHGLFLTKDDIAKIGSFLNVGDGVIGGRQVLEKSRLKEALFRSADADDTGVPIVGSNPASTLGPPQLGMGQPLIGNTRRYAHGFWGKHITPQEFPEFRCSFWGGCQEPGQSCAA